MVINNDLMVINREFTNMNLHSSPELSGELKQELQDKLGFRHQSQGRAAVR